MDSPHLACFKAYDIRGRIPDELNRDLTYAIARAYARWLSPRRVAVGYDVRLTSPEFAEAVRDGLTDSGVDVVDIGRCGTEQVYFATFHLKLCTLERCNDAGVTAFAHRLEEARRMA